MKCEIGGQSIVLFLTFHIDAFINKKKKGKDKKKLYRTKESFQPALKKCATKIIYVATFISMPLYYSTVVYDLLRYILDALFFFLVVALFLFFK